MQLISIGPDCTLIGPSMTSSAYKKLILVALPVARVAEVLPVLYLASWGETNYKSKASNSNCCSVFDQLKNAKDHGTGLRCSGYLGSRNAQGVPLMAAGLKVWVRLGVHGVEQACVARVYNVTRVPSDCILQLIRCCMQSR